MSRIWLAHVLLAARILSLPKVRWTWRNPAVWPLLFWTESMTPQTEDLIKRLEAVEVGSRELDAEVLRTVPTAQVVARFGDYEWRAEGVGIWRAMPSPTTSIDAALVVAERVLPGQWITSIDQWPTRTMIEADEGRPHWTIKDWRALFTEYEAPCRQVKGVAKSPALALCIAILQARSALTGSAGE